MNETAISWTDLTWNAWSGCEKIDPACQHCYAHELAENKRGTLAFPKGFDLTYRPHKLAEPARIKAPSIIFVNSMSDLFLDDVPDRARDQVFDVIESLPRHQFQGLTKRADNMVRYFRRRTPPRNYWAGVTYGHHDPTRAPYPGVLPPAPTSRTERLRMTRYLYDRIRMLQEVDAQVRFISIEPMLTEMPDIPLDGIHWIITGGESGVHMSREWQTRGLAMPNPDRHGPRWIPRPDRVQWVRDVRDQCDAAGVALWHKQWGGPRPDSAGKLLDGQVRQTFPAGVLWHPSSQHSPAAEQLAFAV